MQLVIAIFTCFCLASCSAYQEKDPRKLWTHWSNQSFSNTSSTTQYSAQSGTWQSPACQITLFFGALFSAFALLSGCFYACFRLVQEMANLFRPASQRECA